MAGQVLRQGQRERRALALDGPDPHVAAVGGGDVLDDRQAQPGAAGGAVPGRVDPVEALEDPVDLAGGMPMPWSTTETSTCRRPPWWRPAPSSPRRSRTPRWRPGWRPRRSPASRCRGPRGRGAGRDDVDVASSWRRWRWSRPRTRARRRGTPRVGVSSGSSAWSRDSSMICWTSRLSRSVSVSIRSANRLTASGSSEASATASDSSRMAPTGVLSSWLTLATKSRRTSSIRRSRVRSSTRASTSRLPSGATRAVTWRAVPPRARHHQLHLTDLAVAAYLRDHLAHDPAGQHDRQHQHHVPAREHGARAEARQNAAA